MPLCPPCSYAPGSGHKTKGFIQEYQAQRNPNKGNGAMCKGGTNMMTVVEFHIEAGEIQ